jgi:hypothetical protein
LYICLGASHEGDIAIDDLRIFENPCVITPADADPATFTTTTTTITTTGTTSPLGTYDCTFENGICNGWDNMANNLFNWTLVQALSTVIPRMLLCFDYLNQKIYIYSFFVI